jgi:branched-chain amino acid transport system permease protein
MNVIARFRSVVPPLPQLPVLPWWMQYEKLPRWARTVSLVVLVVVALLLPSLLPRYWQGVLFFPVGVYILLALGLNVVVGMAGLLDLGYVAFYAVGAYTTAVLTVTHGWTTWQALPAAVALAMAAGILLGAPTLRLRGDYLAIVTLGFGEIVRISANNSEALGSTRGIVGIPHPSSIGPIEFEQLPLPYVRLAMVMIVLAVLAVGRLNRSAVGRSWAALREDEDAAEAVGVNTFSMKLRAFAIGASTGGLAGWLYAGKVGYVNPENFPLFLSFTILAAVVLGGMGSVRGVILGAFALAFIPEYLRDLAAGEEIAAGLHTVIGGADATVTEYRVLLFGVALVVMMIFRPQGLLPNRRRASELRPQDHEDEPLVEESVATAAADERLVPRSVIRADVPDVVLQVDGLGVAFGGLRALDHVSLDVRRGEIMGIIGPNGAGKTTLFNCMTGTCRPDVGTVRVGGVSVVGRKRHQIAKAGLARTFQNIRLFGDMTLMENVMVAVESRSRVSVLKALLPGRSARRADDERRDEAKALLRFAGLESRADDLARHLSYGDQRRLEIARAMACAPMVLLLDEPAAGMNPTEKVELTRLIGQVRASGITVVLIEHDVALVMGVCDRITVLDFGKVVASGMPGEVRRDPKVIECYLGVDDDVAAG